MIDTVEFARAHYNAIGLTERIREALLKVVPEHQTLTVTEIAPMDHFHTRGVIATKDLGDMAAVQPETRVLDLGCGVGVGGPARFLAATFGCQVVGVDLSETFIETATYLTQRCALQDQVSFRVGNALDMPFGAGTFDLVLLQHVAMNIEDRAGLYGQIANQNINPT